jgi:hypothetical protein
VIIATLVVFGRDVRHEAEVHHWRYEVVSAKDEGLLLYCGKRISSIEIALLPNGTVGISMRWLRQQRKRRL